MPEKKPTSRRIRKTTRDKISENPEIAEVDASPEGNGPEVVQAMNEAVQALAQSLTNIASSLQERQAEHTQKYYAALMSTAPEDDGKQLSAAYQTVLDAVASQDANRIAAAQKAYTDLLAEFMKNLTENSEAATEEYAADYQDLIDEVQKHGREQYCQYIDTLGNVMTKASNDDLSPATLSLVAQNMASAAMLSQGLFPPSE